MPILYKKDAKKFINSMMSAKRTNDVEKAVESGINDLLRTYFEKNVDYKDYSIELSYPYNTDGVLTVDGGLFGNQKILVEAKKDVQFLRNKSDVAMVLSQVVCYLKKFQVNGEVLPNVVVCGDNDEIFAIPTTLLKKYLKKDYDWTIAPSSAATQNTELFKALTEDKNIRPFVKTIDEDFDAESFCNLVNSHLNDEDPEKVVVSTSNLEKLFVDFSWRVFKGETVVPNKAQIDIFINGLRGSDEIYAHPKKSNTIVLNNKEFLCDSEKFVDFWNHYDSNNYSLDELKSITEIADTLIDEFDRRFSGDFWTPKLWVDEAHRMIEKQLGEDWKEKYIVWDPAAGSKNLTRDYYFKKGLYSSTLFEEELSIASDYNPEGKAFQYDFLNDDIELHFLMNTDGLLKDDEYLSNQFKLPVELINSLRNNEPIVFLGNPPYGQSSGVGASGEGMTENHIGKLMKEKKYGSVSQELYTQFIYRVQMLAKQFNYTKDFFFFFFFNKGFLTSANASKFTTDLTHEFEYKSGFMLNAGEFQGTSSAWGIIFTGWEIKDPNADEIKENQTTFLFEVLHSDKNKVEILKSGEWIGRLADKFNSINKIIPKLEQQEMIAEFPFTGNGFEKSNGKRTYITRIPKKSFGYFHFVSNNVQFSDKYTGLYTMTFNSNSNGTPITNQNFSQVALTFSVRRSVQEKIAEQKLLWVRDKDVFKKPSEELASNQEFINDCVIYSLIDRQSNQTSLRNYEYNNQTYRVINEFFPFEQSFIKELAVKNLNREIESDLIPDTNKERFVNEWLKDKELSNEAQELLNTVKEIYELSFKYRKDYKKNDKYNLNAWDAGWKQVYVMAFSTFASVEAKADEELQEKYAIFKQQRKALGDKIAQQAFDDGII